MKLIIIPTFKNKSSKAGWRKGNVPKEVSIVRSMDDLDGVHKNEISVGDFSYYHDVYAPDDDGHNQNYNKWKREKAELEDKLKFLVEQAKRQDDMIFQMWTKLQNRTTDAQLDKLEEALVRLETTLADNKRLAAENKHLKSLLRRQSSQLTDVLRRRPSKTQSVREEPLY